MIMKRATTLSSYTRDRLARGSLTFTRDQAVAELGLNPGAFLDAAERLQKQGYLVRPRNGFYVVVPPQFLTWGAPPPAWYIDDLMWFLGDPYYVGLLKAAELHGAAHQAVMEFQVVTNRQLKPIEAGRSRIVFYYRKELDAVASDIKPHKTDSGSMQLASPELTAWDLIRYAQASGGINQIATVLTELGPKLQPNLLAALAPTFERATLQRLGFLLDRVGQHAPAYALAPIMTVSKVTWVELDPGDASLPDFAPSVLQRDPRWKVVVRREPEPDA
jgi:predicted transcriptional regulator of viral defense system